MQVASFKLVKTIHRKKMRVTAHPVHCNIEKLRRQAAALPTLPQNQRNQRYKLKVYSKPTNSLYRLTQHTSVSVPCPLPTCRLSPKYPRGKYPLKEQPRGENPRAKYPSAALALTPPYRIESQYTSARVTDLVSGKLRARGKRARAEIGVQKQILRTRDCNCSCAKGPNFTANLMMPLLHRKPNQNEEPFP